MKGGVFLEMTKIRIVSLDQDTFELKYIYNEELEKYFGEYPDFNETPRYTPNGKPWVNVTDEDCPYCEGEYGDCGSCPYLLKEQEKDLIGICTHELKTNNVRGGKDYGK